MIADQPAVLIRDVVDECDCSRDTAKRDLDALTDEMEGLHHVQAAGGQHVYVLVDAVNPDRGPLAEIEEHARNSWITHPGGKALLTGLGLTLVVLFLSTVTSAFLAWDMAGVRTLRAVSSLLGWLAVVLVVGGAYVLWRNGSLLP